MMNHEEMVSLVAKTQWYHRFEIVPGIITPGRAAPNLEFLDQMGLPRDLHGKRVLDIGPWDGPSSFELERRGAKVVALDIQDPDKTAFNVAKKILNSSVEHVVGTVYDLDPKRLGQFDMVYYSGVFYHLKHPLLAFLNIHKLLLPGGRLFFLGRVLDHAFLVDEVCEKNRNLIEKIVAKKLPVSMFVNGAFGTDISTWFVPTTACLEEWLKASGFVNISQTTYAERSISMGSADMDPEFVNFEHEVIRIPNFRKFPGLRTILGALFSGVASSHLRLLYQNRRKP